MGSARTLADRYGGVRRQLRALLAAIAEEDPDSLPLILELQEQIAHGLDVAVHGMRERGHTDGEIAAELGVSRQAVSKRWPGDGRYVGAAGRYRQATPPPTNPEG